MKLKGFILSLILFTAGFAQSQTVAVVGKKKISKKEFNQKYKETEVSFNRPSPRLFLEDLIRYNIGLQEAKKLKIDKDPEFRNRIEQEMYKLLLERKLGKAVQNIKVTEKDMRAEYKRSPELRTQHILVEFKPGATKKQIQAAKKRADEIYREVQKSKRPFQELVKLYSDDSLSKPTGGDIGYVTRATAVPTYYNAALKLKPGQISAPVRSRYGFHIIKLTSRRSFDQANRRQLRQIVFEAKRKAVFDRYFNQLKKRYKVSINQNAVKSLGK